MMEEGDDQGSGWLEVKKKHRTSSKLSNQKVTGGSFNKRQAYSPFFQSSKTYEVGNSHSKRQVYPTNEGLSFSANAKVSSDGYNSSLLAADHGIACLDKVVDNKESGQTVVLSCMSVKVAAPEGDSKVIPEVLTKQNVDAIPKIKWGDFEDVPDSPPTGCGTPAEIINTDVVDGLDGVMLEYADAVITGGPVIGASPDSPLQLGKVEPEGAELLQGILSSDVHDEPTAQTWKRVNEFSCANVTVANISPKDANENIEDNCGSDISSTTRIEPNGDMYPSDVILKECPSPLLLVEPLSPVGIIEEVTLDKPQDKSKDVTLNSLGTSIMNENAVMNDDRRDSNLVPQISDAVEISADACITEAIEGQKVLHDDSTEGTDLGEYQQGVSKERFRERLWCFLFENLNRAVDELYLLCELECDMVQMNEAILVLEEAASDFKELKCRVEHFENTKRSTSQSSKDGVPLSMKTDHRRPHALSWEVHRMTTSPHRAEILSSSLEAFKKIQLERASRLVVQDAKGLRSSVSTTQHDSRNPRMLSPKIREQITSLEKRKGAVSIGQGNTKMEKLNVDAFRQNRAGQLQNGRMPSENQSSTAVGKSKKEPLKPISETDKPLSRKDRAQTETRLDRQSKAVDIVKKQNLLVEKEKQKEKEKEKEKHNLMSWKPMDAWKEKRNWEDILKSPLRSSNRISHSPGLARRGMERARVLHDKLMSPEKKKKTALDLKREAEDKHARAMRIRSQLENERVQRLQRTSEKLNRVNEWQAVRSMKLREGMYARHQQGVSRHEAYLAQVARRAGDESSKVNEVRFITSLNEENKKLVLRQKLHDSEMRRAEKLQVIRSKQKEDIAREEAALERRKLLEAEKLQRIAETQRKKEDAQVRREEERKASSAAREAKALVQLRKKEVRAKAQQEEAEVLAQKLAERLSESEQRRKSYLEQIRERASMDYRDQSSPLLRRSFIKEGQARFVSINSVEDFQTSCTSGADSTVGLVDASNQQSLKRRIKKIRQRLMSLKYEFTEPSLSPESSGIGFRALLGTARAKIGRWIQELQRLRQARKEGAVSIGLIVGEMVKFLEGKDPELHASRQAGLLDFISSALPASHTSKPEACQVTLYLLRLLRVVLSAPGNRSYFLVQNLLPPIIPMLSASLENYIKIAASSSVGCSNILTGKASSETLGAITEILDGFLWTVTIILGHACNDERQLQMQDGLLELIVAYQIIHRLRDLFALYDRPQVEGSPFPTSILQSLKLLAVLSSRSRTISSIDWKACMSKAESGNRVEEAKILESQDIGETTMINSPSEHMTADFPTTDSSEGDEKLRSSNLSLEDIRDSRPLDCQFIKEPSTISDSRGDRGTAKIPAAHEAQNIVVEEHTKSASPLKDENISINGCIGIKRNECRYKHPVVFLLSAIAETGLVGLPSLLTAVLLQANNRLSSEKSCYILPSNFEEVAIGVLKVLNSLALLDIAVLQRMLARPDLKMELFHLMSFLLSYCTTKWKTANDQVGVLLLETLLLLGYFALFHPGNQAVLRWGKSPTILHKVCDLPFVFFSDPEMTPILASTLAAACYGCDQNRGLVLQELSVDMLLSLLKSCRQGLLPTAQPTDVLQQESSESCNNGAQQLQESKKHQGDVLLKPNRRGSKGSLGKGGVSGSNSNVRATRAKTGREGSIVKACDEWALRHSLPSSETSHTFMLHQRFPTVFLDRAEEFFVAGSLDLQM